MKKILLAGWLADTLYTWLPFLRKRAPWYRRSGVTGSPWLPAALIAPFGLFLLIEGARRHLPSSSAHAHEDETRPSASDVVE